ncbi:MAG: hypothetical protein JNL63_07570 [Bacteroidia bacterium]|nr:hypothetical protein [Bacteroidia bacterium]
MKRIILISVLSLSGFCIPEAGSCPNRGFNFALPDDLSVNLIYYKPIADITIKSIQSHVFRDENLIQTRNSQVPIIFAQEARLRKVIGKMFLGSKKWYYPLLDISVLEKYFLQLKIPPGSSDIN